MADISKQKGMKKQFSLKKKRKRKENEMKDLQQNKSLNELTESVGQIFFKKNCVDYEQIHADLINNNLVPLCNNYISNYGGMYINKDFLITECIQFCNTLSDKNKVLHVEKCIEFVRYLIAFQEEGVKYRNIKRKFYLNNYPILGVGDLSNILREIDNIWKQRKKYFKYKMSFNVQRMSALFYGINNFNNNLILKYKEFEQKNIISVLTETFIEKEINDCDFEKINKYWQQIPVKDFEGLENLGSINIQEWKLIEEAFV